MDTNWNNILLACTQIFANQIIKEGGYHGKYYIGLLKDDPVLEEIYHNFDTLQYEYSLLRSSF